MPFKLNLKVLQALETQLPKLEVCVEPPEMTEKNGIPVFRYQEQIVEQALLQKAARVISGLHASALLLEAGHIQELRVIYRTLDEFGEDIVFLSDVIISGDCTKLHEEYLEDFWAEEFDEDATPFQSSQKRKRVSRDKIQAAIARLSNSPVNPSDGQELHRTVAKTLSGYVHGASPHIMEMYGGNPGKFHTSGLTGTPPHAFAEHESLSYFYRGLLYVILVAFVLGSTDVERELRLIKDEFEVVTGQGQGDAETKIKKLKNET